MAPQSQFTVDPQSQHVILTGFTVAGVSQPVFSDAGLSTRVTWPQTITGAVTYYVGIINAQGILTVTQLDGTALEDEFIPLSSVGNPTVYPVPTFPQVAADESANSGTYIAPSKIAPVATGVAATDTANLQAAVNATPAGGMLYLRNGTYALNAALTITNHISIVGENSYATYTSQTAGGGSETPSSPYLAGVVLNQTVAATDGLLITGSGIAVNLENIGILFSAGLLSTGHGINATPTQLHDTGHDKGIFECRWENVTVYGHDGNHYATNIVNPAYVEVYHFRSYGGGGVKVISDGGTVSFGNMVWTQPYIFLINTGTSHGIAQVSNGTAGGIGLDLMLWLRPQVNVAAGPAGNGQLAYTDLTGSGQPPTYTTLVAPDFEGDTAAGMAFAPTTVLVGSLFGPNQSWTSYGTGALPYDSAHAATGIGYQALAANAANYNTAVGSGALKANTSGTKNTAVGDSALNLTVTNNSSTALGYLALGNATADSNTAVGANAALQTLTGGNNTAVGAGALQTSTAGTQNVAVGATAVQFNTASDNVGIGMSALYGVPGSSTGGRNIAIGTNALSGLTTGLYNVAIGYGAGLTVTAGNKTVSAQGQTIVGYFAGQASSTQVNYITTIGYQAVAGAAGAVAIGTDHTGAGATTSTQDVIALGTANHQVQIKNNTTGAGSAALGANCPAVTATAPYTWMKMMSSDGSTVYVPAWK